MTKQNPERLMILYRLHIAHDEVGEQGQGANIPHVIEFRFQQRAMVGREEH